MGWNGSGLYSRIHDWTTDAGNSINIDATRMDAEDDSIAAGINNCMTKDGQNSATANLNLGGFKLTNGAKATARTDFALASNVQDGGLIYGVTGGTANVQTLTLSPAPAAYVAPLPIYFKCGISSTAATTLNINGLGAKSVKNADGSDALLVLNQMYHAVYDGTDIIIISSEGPGHEVGDVVAGLQTTAPTGWIMMDDGNIGDAGSGATTRANADTEALFTLLWDNVSDTYAPVSTGRGASAAADFAAGKTIGILTVLGHALGAAGAGSGLTSRALGLNTGVETRSLSSGNNGSHTHSESTSLGDGVNDLTGGTVNNWLHQSGTTGSSGSGTAFGIMQPTFFLNFRMKL